MANSEVSRLKFNDTTYEIADELARESVGTALTEVASVEAKADAYNTALSGRITNLENSSGAVLVAKTRTAMSDTNKIYVYTGTATTASGVTYTPGHWYFHNGSSWTDGGEYNQNLDAIDATLTNSNKGADAKVTGDRLSAAESDISKLRGTIANDYASQVYSVGDYCYHDGLLYRCNTEIAAAEAWTSSHWTAVDVMPEISNLKNDIENTVGIENLISGVEYTDNYYIDNDGVVTSNSLFCYTSLISVEQNKEYRLSLYVVPNSSNNYLRVHGYDKDGNWISRLMLISGTTNITTFTVPDNAAYIRISKNKTNQVLNYLSRTDLYGSCLKLGLTYYHQSDFLMDIPSGLLSDLPVNTINSFAGNNIDAEDEPCSNFLGTVVTFSSESSAMGGRTFQIAVSENSTIYIRSCYYLDKQSYWNAWKKLVNFSNLDEVYGSCLKLGLTYYHQSDFLMDIPSGLLSDLPVNTINSFAGNNIDAEDEPCSNFLGTVVTFSSESSAMGGRTFQIAVSENSTIYIRSCYYLDKQSYWNAWKKLVNFSNLDEVYSNIDEVYSNIDVIEAILAKNVGFLLPNYRLTQRSSNRIVIAKSTIFLGDVVVFEAGSTVKEILIEKYDEDNTYIGDISWTLGQHYFKIDFNGFITCVYRKENGSDLDVTDYDANTYIIRSDSIAKKQIETIYDEADIHLIKRDDIIQGAYNRNGSVPSDLHDYRIRLEKFIRVSVGDKVVFDPGYFCEGILTGIVNPHLPTIETSWTYEHLEFTCQYSGLLMLMFRRKARATSITPNQFDCSVKVIRNLKYNIGSKIYNGEMFRSNYVPGIGNHRDSDSTFTLSYSSLISDYDRIMNRINSYYSDVDDNVPKPLTITKDEVITTDSSYVLYKYTFTPAYPKKRIMLQAGVHGNEYEGVFGLYHLIRFMCSSEYVYPKLKQIIQNCEIVVIPLINPYGFEHNTKMNGDGINIHETYADETGVPKEMTAIRTVANNGHYDYAMDIHTDPYTPAKGCYGYAYTKGDMYEFLYKEIMNFRDIVYQEFNFTSHYYSNDKDIIVGRIPEVSSGGGSIGYFHRLGVPANLIEIATGAASSSSSPFAETGSDDMMRIAVDWYANVLIKAYEQISN